MKVFHSWLDRWDERKAQRGDDVKERADFIFDGERAFPDAKSIKSAAEFCEFAEAAVMNPAFFDDPNTASPTVERVDQWIKFPSGVSTDVEQNNTVWARVTESGSRGHALIVFHHWNANARNDQIAQYFSRRGITVIEIAMPYHLERSRPGSSHADYMLSPNLGRTIQSMRQAVLDGRRLIQWLKLEGYGKISVFGMSLGSWVAGLVAAHDTAVSKASLFLTADSLADMVWTGRATRLVRASLAANIQLEELRKAWVPLSLKNYTQKLARPELELQIVLAKRDMVVLPELSSSFVRALREAGADSDVLSLNCGHYSLAMPPYILLAGWKLSRFLR